MVAREMVKRSFEQALTAVCIEWMVRELVQVAVDQAIPEAIARSRPKLLPPRAAPPRHPPPRADGAGAEEAPLRAAIPLCDQFLAEEIEDLVMDLAADALMSAYEDEGGRDCRPTPLVNVSGARVARQPGTPTLSLQTFEIYNNTTRLFGGQELP